MDLLKYAAKLIIASNQQVALTGAGISTSSGIPDFRGSHGLWMRYNPSIYAHVSTFMTEPGKIWELTNSLYEIITNSKPNPAHIALAEMENSGFLKALITQNVDGLHKMAGSHNIIEFHGTVHTAICLKCHEISNQPFYDIPLCPKCGTVLKPGFTLFGESVPYGAFMEASNLASYSDIFLVIGTSAVVQPAADLPFIAKKNGAKIIEMNIKPSGLTNYITDCFIQGDLKDTLPDLFTAIIKK